MVLNVHVVLTTTPMLADASQYLAEELGRLGCLVTHSAECRRSPAINLVFEDFDVDSVARLRALHATGHRLVCVVTELPTLVTDRGLVWNYRAAEPYWERRAAAFVDAAPLFDVAWCLVPTAADLLRRFVPGAVQVEFAAPCAVEALPMGDPQYDFCFFGSPTIRRERVVAEFRAAGHSVTWPDYHTSTFAERDAAVRAAKVLLDVRQYEWWPLVSNARYATGLRIGRPVVAEPRPREMKGQWDGVIDFVESDDEFLDAARNVLKNWRCFADLQRVRSKNLRSGIDDALAALPCSRSWIEEITPVPLHVHQSNVHTQRTAHEPVIADPIKLNDPPRLVKSIDGVNLVAWLGRVFTVPQVLGRIDLARVNMARTPSIRSYVTLAQAELAVRARRV